MGGRPHGMSGSVASGPTSTRHELTEAGSSGSFLNADAFARLDAQGGITPLFAGTESLSACERRLVESEEAWILGLGHVDALRRALAPHTAGDNFRSGGLVREQGVYCVP